MVKPVAQKSEPVVLLRTRNKKVKARRSSYNEACVIQATLQYGRDGENLVKKVNKISKDCYLGWFGRSKAYAYDGAIYLLSKSTCTDPLVDKVNMLRVSSITSSAVAKKDKNYR